MKTIFIESLSLSDNTTSSTWPFACIEYDCVCHMIACIVCVLFGCIALHICQAYAWAIYRAICSAREIERGGKIFF